ncbi:MAG: hypothetical protein GXO91_06850 [FCB group bacterium]|nr:hypothetical protein [FCB group bacterium]
MNNKSIYFRKRIILIPILAGVFIYMFYVAYRDEKVKTIKEFNARQMLLAEQAANRIEDYFNHYHFELNQFSTNDEIVNFSEQGKELFSLYWISNLNRILSITRVDKTGKIIYTLPDTKSIGKDISGQKHIKKILENHRPVLSNVFKAVQGFDCIAYHVPLFHKNGEFAGTVAVLVQFDELVKRYLTNIRLSDSAVLWVINNFNSVLYRSDTGEKQQIPRTFFSPQASAEKIMEEMIADQPGIVTYEANPDSKGRKIEMQAIHYPVNIADGTWSIIVSTPRSEILASTKGFRRILVLILSGLLLVGILYSYYFLIAWTAYKDKEYKDKHKAELTKMEVQLRQTDRLNTLGVLASGMAHEINNPLMGIIGYAEMIVEKHTSPEQRECAEGIIEEGNRIGKIVRNILGFSRQKTDAIETVTLEKIFNDTFLLIGSRLVKSKIAIVKEIEENLMTIPCRPNQIKQVILNLLINARDALDAYFGDVFDTKKIVVIIKSFTRNNEQWQRLVIEDNGPGIKPEIIEEIFNPFFSTKPKDQGTGLGLAISMGIVEEHHGIMTVESEAGAFTRFILEFPLESSIAAELQDSTDKGPTKEGRSDTITFKSSSREM